MNVHKPYRATISSDQFFEEARAKFDAGLPEMILEEVVPYLPELSGHWHPSGFGVHQLGKHPRLGSLRLHIWPQELRHVQSRGHGLLYSHLLGLVQDGEIHNHAWNILSHAYERYSDKIINIGSLCHNQSEFMGEEGIRSSLDVYRVIRVAYNPAGTDLLKPYYPDASNSVHSLAIPQYGGWVKAHPIESRDLEPGERHTIKAGVFHIPTIPYGRLGATLAWNGPRCADGPDLLLRGPLDTEPYARRMITPGEAETMRDQLNRRPAEKFGVLSPEQKLGMEALKRVLKSSDRMNLAGAHLIGH